MQPTSTFTPIVHTERLEAERVARDREIRLDEERERNRKAEAEAKLALAKERLDEEKRARAADSAAAMR